jgi:hypothetical protein
VAAVVHGVPYIEASRAVVAVWPVKEPVCAVRRWLVRVEVRDLCRLPVAAGECSWGQPGPGGAGEGGSSPDKAGACQHCQMVRVRRT